MRATASTRSDELCSAVPDDKRDGPYVPLDLSFIGIGASPLTAEPVASPTDRVIDASLAEQTRQILSSLTPREEKVLRMRFGIGEEVPATEEVGQDFEVTRERIRQIEAKALAKLRGRK